MEGLQFTMNERGTDEDLCHFGKGSLEILPLFCGLFASVATVVM